MKVQGPTLQVDVLSDKTDENSSNHCGIMEQKPKLVEQVNTGPGNDGLNGLFGSNQDETMRIDSNMEKLLKLMVQILHPKKNISSHFCT